MNKITETPIEEFDRMVKQYYSEGSLRPEYTLLNTKWKETLSYIKQLEYKVKLKELKGKK